MCFRYVNKSQNKDPLVKKKPKDAGWDIRSNVDAVIYPGETMAIDIGIHMAFDDGWYGEIVDRSGLALAGISTRAGIIDSPYREAVGVVLHNERPAIETNGEYIRNLRDQNKFVVNVGDRIAQLIPRQVDLTPPVEVDNLDETDRGAGFGSSGIK
jgi:dUTP pyrophosphatase